MTVVKWIAFLLGQAYIIWWVSAAIRHRKLHEFTSAFAAWIFIVLGFESLFHITGFAYRVFPVPMVVRLTGGGIAVFAIAVIVLAIRKMKNEGRPEKHWEATTRLVQTGIFAVIRHPIYFAVFLLILGVFMQKITLFSLVITLVGFLSCIITAILEDRANEKKFGEDYLEYKRHSKLFFPYFF